MKNLVLSGGGINGIIELGSLKALENLNLLKNIKNYSGSSVGSIICFLLILDFSPSDIFIIIKKIDFSYLVNENIFNLLDTYSLCNIDKTKVFLTSLLELKFNIKKITYIELYNKTKKNLNIIAISLTEEKIVTFNYINTPNLDVIDTLIASCSIPLVFPCKNINNNDYFDAFMINNYPINIFKDDLKSTIGIKVTPNMYQNNNKNTDITSYIFNILNCILKITAKNYDNYTAKINIEIFSEYIPINFNINNEDKNNLFITGYNSTIDIINNYKKKYALKNLKKNRFSKKYYIKYWYNLFLKLI
tara:strand:+ start:619 stop:1530 length:912 start_codon:yes stop_codon:yes gene_type:complete